ncbi:hypothetical protein [Haladaptatus halobius]|nr:hypothetical protein [Haladaptatus halobius]
MIRVDEGEPPIRAPAGGDEAVVRSDAPVRTRAVTSGDSPAPNILST